MRKINTNTYIYLLRTIKELVKLDKTIAVDLIIEDTYTRNVLYKCSDEKVSKELLKEVLNRDNGGKR